MGLFTAGEFVADMFVFWYSSFFLSFVLLLLLLLLLN